MLASSSPRRSQLLSENGIEVVISPPNIDDGGLTCCTVPVDLWVKSLAVMKAENVRQLQDRCDGTVIAADTVCVVDEKIIGQPNNSEDAFSMIQSMTNREHEVYTGWCLQSLNGERIHVGFEVATITLGDISEGEIFNYVSTDAWKGKAGGYNLSERIVAGWPIDYKGDPTSVMGLPMIQLLKELTSD